MKRYVPAQGTAAMLPAAIRDGSGKGDGAGVVEPRDGACRPPADRDQRAPGNGQRGVLPSLAVL